MFYIFFVGIVAEKQFSLLQFGPVRAKIYRTLRNVPYGMEYV